MSAACYRCWVSISVSRPNLILQPARRWAGTVVREDVPVAAMVYPHGRIVGEDGAARCCNEPYRVFNMPSPRKKKGRKTGDDGEGGGRKEMRTKMTCQCIQINEGRPGNHTRTCIRWNIRTQNRCHHQCLAFETNPPTSPPCRSETCRAPKYGSLCCSTTLLSIRLGALLQRRCCSRRKMAIRKRRKDLPDVS